MGAKNRNTPPSDWCDWWATPVTMLTADIGYGWVPDTLTADPGDPNPWFWHWCTHQQRWMGMGTKNHTMTSREPLHLEPSLLWTCCGLHGFVRDGTWIPA